LAAKRSKSRFLQNDQKRTFGFFIIIFRKTKTSDEFDGGEEKLSKIILESFRAFLICDKKIILYAGSINRPEGSIKSAFSEPFFN